MGKSNQHYLQRIVYNEKYTKNKIKSYNGKFNTNFHDNKTPKEGSQFICLSVILIDSVFRTVNNYCPQVFLEEFKHVIKDKKIHNYIADDVEISSDSNQENSYEEILEKIQMEKNSDYEENSDEEILQKIQIKKNSVEEDSSEKN